MNIGMIKRAYLSLFSFIARDRIEKQDTDLRSIHAHLLTVLSTGVLVWAYVWLSFVSMSSMLPVVISFCASVIHLLSPLLFRISKNTFAICSVMLLAGMVHQLISAIYSGGFNSHILIWLGILPMLAGIIVGMRGLIVWTLITTLTCSVLLAMSLYGFQFPGGKTRYLSLIPQAFLVFGWIFINTLMMYAHLLMQRRYQQTIDKKQADVSLLFNVLTHDLSAPIASISAASAAFMNVKEATLQNASKTVVCSCENLVDITQQVRKLYVAHNHESSINCEPYNFAQCVTELESLYQVQLEQKSLSLKANLAELEKIWVNVVPTFFLCEIMGNLVSNAIKFSFRGGEIRIKASVSGQRIMISVEDDGCGMSSSQCENLLKLGQSHSTLGTEAESGLGYGFSIAKAFAAKFGGDISIQSPIDTMSGNDGTRITVNLPKAV